MSLLTKVDAAGDTLPGPLWSAMPGWGISADLIPPEVIASRQLRVIRRRGVSALIGIVLLCALVYGFAVIQSHRAANSLAAEQTKTTQLQAAQSKYAEVTKIQGSVADVKRQLSVLMADDVAYAGLIEQLRAGLPPGMTIGELTVTVDTGKTSSSASSGSAGAATLDASGRKHIGTITISGTGQALSDTSSYVDQLRKIRGVVEPYPLTNKAKPPGTEYSLQLTLTDELLTHKYDAGKSGGN